MGRLADLGAASTSPQDAPRLLTMREAAARLTISLRSLRTLLALGKLPTVRVTTRRVAIDEADLAAYIVSRRSRARG